MADLEPNVAVFGDEDSGHLELRVGEGEEDAVLMLTADGYPLTVDSAQELYDFLASIWYPEFNMEEVDNGSSRSEETE